MAFPNRAPKERHPGHYRKPKAEKKVPLKQAMAQAGFATLANPYKDGKTRIYLDDDRACPPGWTLAKNVTQFKAALDACPPADLAGVSLDWYLGHDLDKGTVAAEALAAHLIARPTEFEALEIICCHSSELKEAANMARSIAKAIKDLEGLRWVSIQVGQPVDTRWNS